MKARQLAKKATISLLPWALGGYVCACLMVPAAHAQGLGAAKDDMLPPPSAVATPSAAQPQKAAPQPSYLSNDQLKSMYEKAYHEYNHSLVGGPVSGTLPAAKDDDSTVGNTAAGATDNSPIDLDAATKQSDVPAAPNKNGKHLDYAPLNAVPLTVSYDNLPISQVMQDVVKKISTTAGPWKLDWRLKEEDRYIRDTRVNLTAETNFGQFMSYLVDHINNMSGVHLFVQVFEKSRIIIITDTY